MKVVLPFLLLTLALSSATVAQSLNEYRWKSRVLLVFTPSPDDPNFLKQYQSLRKVTEELDERNVIVMFLTPKGKYENTGIFLRESPSKYFYDFFGVRPYQLETILVGLDGSEKFRAKNTFTPPSVLLQLIDQMPMRRAELQGYGNKSQLKRENGNIPPKQRYE